MAEESSHADNPQPPPFLEVICKISGKKNRFASGTKAGFAVSLINRKSGLGDPLVFHIEAVKEGEESISFGPDAALVNYGDGWNLQTVAEADVSGSSKGESVKLIQEQIYVKSFDSRRPRKEPSNPEISFAYIGKILMAFVLMFVLAAIFTLSLENLPILISYINSSI